MLWKQAGSLRQWARIALHIVKDDTCVCACGGVQQQLVAFNALPVSVIQLGVKQPQRGFRRTEEQQSMESGDPTITRRSVIAPFDLHIVFTGIRPRVLDRGPLNPRLQATDHAA